MLRISAAVAALTLVSTTLPASASEAASQVIDQARRDCRLFENGVLETTPQAIAFADLTGDAKPEEIVDASQFSCSTAASLFCGTGGCTITVIVDGTATEFLAKGWKVVDWSGQPILLLAVHGSACGGTNLRRCFKALVWSEGDFRSVDPRPDNDR